MTTTSSRQTRRVVVLGVGNVLLRDEGIGVHVANALEHEQHDVAAPPATSSLDADYLARLGVAERLAAWRNLCLAPVQQGANQ